MVGTAKIITSFAVGAAAGIGGTYVVLKKNNSTKQIPITRRCPFIQNFRRNLTLAQQEKNQKYEYTAVSKSKPTKVICNISILLIESNFFTTQTSLSNSSQGGTKCPETKIEGTGEQTQFLLFSIQIPYSLQCYKLVGGQGFCRPSVNSQHLI